MSSIQRRRLQIEVLESRDVLSTTTTVIDPTLQPADPSGIAMQVVVTDMGAATDGQHYSITVQGLSDSNLQPGGSFTVVVGGVAYVVDAVTVTESGDYQLLVLGGVASGTTGDSATVIIGGDTTLSGTTSTTQETSSTGLAVIDPTLDPQP